VVAVAIAREPWDTTTSTLTPGSRAPLSSATVPVMPPSAAVSVTVTAPRPAAL
jgi:hypothetical protein